MSKKDGPQRTGQQVRRDATRDVKRHHTGTVQALHQGAKRKLMGWKSVTVPHWMFCGELDMFDIYD